MNQSAAHISALLLVAGLSGAGKSTALDTLADSGFYVIDNLPVALLPQFLEFSKSAPIKFKRSALLLDIESRDKLEELLRLLESLDLKAGNIHLLFLDCKNEVILRRYSETRRPHPGFDPNRDHSLEDTIQRERSRLLPLKEIAHCIIDSSELNAHELRREVRAYVESLSKSSSHVVRVNFLSFGFKYGAPIDCDLMVDVRFLPNPFFVPELKDKSGLDEAVAGYVLSNPQAQEFIKKYADLLQFLLPKYAFEGKSYLNIGVGCTGGKHRSVAIAHELQRHIPQGSYLVSVKHRDVAR